MLGKKKLKNSNSVFWWWFL